MSALQIVGIVLGAIALLIAAILCIPGRLLISYSAEGGLAVSGSVLFFRIGGKEKKADAPKKKPGSEASSPKLEEASSGKKASPDPRALLRHTEELTELLGKALNALGKLARSVTVRELSLTCVVGGDDPAEAADTYGRVCAILYPALGLLHETLRVREDREEITIGCAFGEESRLAFRSLLQLRVVHVLRAALPLTSPALKLLRGLRRDGAAARRQPPAKASSRTRSD